MRKRVTYYILIAIYLIYCIFYVINICNYDDYQMRYCGIAFMAVWLLLHCFVQHNFEGFFVKLFILCLFVIFFSSFYRFDFYKYHGLSIIRSAVVIEVSHSKEVYSDIKFRYHISYIKRTIYGLRKYKKGSEIFVIDPIECNNPVFKEYKDTTKYSQIHDFAFLDDTTFYTYHDFSLIKPDFVYYQVGFNIVYKATFDGEYLHFVDVCKKNQKVKYTLNTNKILCDTFLVYKNVNEEIDDRFIVCAPEINTPENWSKISDYGYIFHYDIYSKEEIETQCPQIKNYVEKFKERNINSNEN